MKTLINMALVLMLLFVSCKAQKHNEIDTLLKSAEASDIILGNYLIGEAHDSSYVKQLLCNTDDSRISHDVRFKGISVYQSKMIALKKISNIQPPRLITYEPDTLIVNFYKDWAAKKNLNKLQ